MIDGIDKKLLALLAENARLSYTDLSKAVHISRPSVTERISRFLELGIIERFTAVLNYKKIGRPICSFLHISDIKRSVEEMLKLFDRDEIIEAYSITGENNFIIKVAVSDMECLERLLEDLMPYCKVVTSLIITQYPLKRTFSP